MKYMVQSQPIFRIWFTQITSLVILVGFLCPFPKDLEASYSHFTHINFLYKAIDASLLDCFENSEEVEKNYFISHLLNLDLQINLRFFHIIEIVTFSIKSFLIFHYYSIPPPVPFF